MIDEEPSAQCLAHSKSATNGSFYCDKPKHLQERQEGMVRKNASFAVMA